MQIYRARPRTAAAPSAFIDTIRETRVYQGVSSSSGRHRLT